MPEDSKKSHHKGKHEVKEQRKPRQQRHHAAENPEKKVEKNVEVPKVAAPQKPAYEDPGPEFYKGLKRETEEILKITEEANAKYKKKEIQSNWTKYEMPIESYEEINEQENLGADYEKLIQAPMSVGGHFQFKHEKSWDITTGPSLYDKYFQIDMENLATAINTIPFYERNNLDQSLFTPTDINTMNSRATKYKRKYYNDKSYSTPELEAQDAILNNMRGKSNEKEEISEKNTSISESEDIVQETNNETTTAESKLQEINLEAENIDTDVIKENSLVTHQNVIEKEEDQAKDIKIIEKPKEIVKISSEIDDIDDLIQGSTQVAESTTKSDCIEVRTDVAPIVSSSNTTKAIESTNSAEQTTKPVIESPEDLEKWLDDFLDG